ncbi:hypothetical protein PAPYR_798 [Paratrimastix pyriformis]|uniref:Uncharacterized protein n=1 Tax=Paratrimastix pyriformis TaxID=342808 RepID=A0ABQ8UUH8_9EUKA|nr:hypothetical protein PAPYR_798 [Paratrimastix pyriformis]
MLSLLFALLLPAIIAESTDPLVVLSASGSGTLSLSNDELIVNREGYCNHTLSWVPYSSGYLSMKDSPLNKPYLGTPYTRFRDLDTLSPAQNLSVVERFDLAMELGTGRPGRLEQKYTRVGKKKTPQFWEGLCDRWSAQALNPILAPFLKNHILYKGLFFSIAEQRALATAVGATRKTIVGPLFDKHVTAADILKMQKFFVADIGVVGNTWLVVANEGRREVWNFPFYSIAHNITLAPPGSSAYLAAIPRFLNHSDHPVRSRTPLESGGTDQLRWEQTLQSGNTTVIQRDYFVYDVSTNALCALEKYPDADGWEGPTEVDTMFWHTYLLVNASTGAVLSAVFAADSNDTLEFLWVPRGVDQSPLAPEEEFFYEMLHHATLLPTDAYPPAPPQEYPPPSPTPMHVERPVVAASWSLSAHPWLTLFSVVAALTVGL